ncbi:MAG: phosphotransferase [bacterium]|nr:phosphotransferase [bacterium]
MTDRPMSAPHKPDNLTDARNKRVTYANTEARELLCDQINSMDAPSDENWTLVKRNSSRSVYRGTVGQTDIYLKHFHGRSLSHRIARILGISQAARELYYAKYLTDSGVETPRPLAASKGKPEWYAAQAVENAVPGDQWHEMQLNSGHAGQREINHATIELAGLVGRMHDSGVIHRDLHCGNILVTTRKNTTKLILTDLHRLKRKMRLSRLARTANLAQLLHDRRNTTTRTQRLRFLKHYLTQCGLRGTLRGWELMVDQMARRYTRKHHAHRDRRINGKGRYFTTVSLDNHWKGLAILASKHRPPGSVATDHVFTCQQWKEVLSRGESLLEGDDVEVIKDSPSGRVVRRRLKVGDVELDVHIKRPRRKRAWKAILDCLRPSRSLRAFRIGHQIMTRGVDTAVPLAAIEKRVAGFLTDSILITETVSALHLNQFLHVRLSHVTDPQLADLSQTRQETIARNVLDNLGLMVRRLHDNNLVHRDLKSGNILVHWTIEDGPNIVVIDLDGLKRVARISMRQRFQGLMRLNVSLLECTSVSHTGRLRMLLGYLRRPGIGRIQFKPYWRVLQQWSAKKLSQQITSRRKRQRKRHRKTQRSSEASVT